MHYTFSSPISALDVELLWCNAEYRALLLQASIQQLEAENKSAADALQSLESQVCTEHLSTCFVWYGHPVFLGTTHASLDLQHKTLTGGLPKTMFLIMSDTFAFIRKHCA